MSPSLPAALSSRYVAQDNILTLPGERILHRALNHYFSGHSRVLGRYIPSKKLQYEVRTARQHANN